MSDIQIEDEQGNKVTVTQAHWDRYPQLANSFRLVSEKTTPVVAPVTPVTITPPTGDKNKEN